MPEESKKREALEELLKSPLEQKGRQKRSGKEAERSIFGPDGPPPPGRPLGLAQMAAIGLVLGGLIGVTGFWLGNRNTPVEQVIASPLTAATATTSAPSAIDSSLLPAGYIAINDLIGIKAERFLRTDDRIVVSFSVAVREGLDPDETRGFTGGVWALESGGVTTPSVAEFFDPEAPGVFSVEFANDIPPIDDSTAIRLEGEVERNFVSIPVNRSTTYPVDLGEGQILEIAPFLSVEIDSFTIDDDGGRVAWHLNAPPEVRAALDVTVLLLDGQNDTSPAVYVERGQVGIRNNFGTSARPDPLTRDGVEVLVTEIPPDAEEPVSEADIFFGVTFGTINPIDEVIPLAGLRETTLGE